MRQYALLTFFVVLLLAVFTPACKHDPLFNVDPDPTGMPTVEHATDKNPDENKLMRVLLDDDPDNRMPYGNQPDRHVDTAGREK